MCPIVHEPWKPASPAELTVRAHALLAAGADDTVCFRNHALREDPLTIALREAAAQRRSSAGRTGRIRLIYGEDALGDPADAELHLERGALVRLGRAMPPGAMLLTATGAIVTTRAEGDGHVVVHDPAVLRTLRSLADLLWQRAEPLPARAEPPSPAERELLHMLTEGLTDQAVARRLGMSERTVRRLMAQLMERLNARSRFEAGVRAVEHGWI